MSTGRRLAAAASTVAGVLATAAGLLVLVVATGSSTGFAATEPILALGLALVIAGVATAAWGWSGHRQRR